MKSSFYEWIKISSIIFSTAFILLFANTAIASKTDNVFGYWYSDGIGWISLNNCSDPATCSGSSYGVKINENTNEVSGWAWSDIVGWITFNANDWSDTKDITPPGGLTTENNFGIRGWARAINGKYTPHSTDGRDNRGGYDGWISLGGSSYGFDIDLTKDLASGLGANYTNKVVRPITGYGWGDIVTGWVQSNSAYHKSFVVFDKKCDPAIDPTCAKHDHNYFEITVNGKNSASIVGGDTINIDWRAKQTFYPIECIGTLGGSNSPYPDNNWTTKTNGYSYQQQTGTYSSIHVPPSGATTFRLTCTDNTNVYYDEVDITSKFTGGIMGGACIKDETTTPTITWTTNDTSPQCTITAEPFYADFTPYKIPTSGYLTASGNAPFTINDTNYKHKDTFYKLNCTNGDSGYEASVGPITSYVKMCSNAVDYSITKTPSACNYLTETSDPTIYRADTTKLTLIPENFTADVDVNINTTNGTPKGNIDWTPTSQQFTYNSTSKDYNTISADYTISFTELSKKIKSTTYNPSIKGYFIESIDLDIKGKSQNRDTKNEALLYCYATCDPNDSTCKPCDPKTDPLCAPKTKTKPKYVPF